eukprot:6158524-Amphidinium_carterae.1
MFQFSERGSPGDSPAPVWIGTSVQAVGDHLDHLWGAGVRYRPSTAAVISALALCQSPTVTALTGRSPSAKTARSGQGSQRAVRFTKAYIENLSLEHQVPAPPGFLEPPPPPADLPPPMSRARSGGGTTQSVRDKTVRIDPEGEIAVQSARLTQTNSAPSHELPSCPASEVAPKMRRLQAVSAKILTANKFSSMTRLLNPTKCNEELGETEMGKSPSADMKTSNATAENAYQDLGLRSAFRKETERSQSQRRLASSLRQSTVNTVSQRYEENMTVIAYDGILRYFIATPTSSHRLLWESVGAILIAFDLLFVPMSIIFQPPEEAWMYLANWVSLGYWTINIPATLFAS